MNYTSCLYLSFLLALLYGCNTDAGKAKDSH